MTRTNRTNSSGHADSHAIPESATLPRLFGKAPFQASDQPPYKSKKDGAGRGNWGREGDEIEEVLEQYNLNPAIQRRRSNSNGGSSISSASSLSSSSSSSYRRPSFDQKTKFEEVEEEVFDED
ncbi:hypothetical protein V1514DRAFT_317886 [Lipomyces japonicus]|uniref:uncharacterized protein n=1 Tax=Lipomyces japonicus TaxID=56871 RepID=UPI0034CE00D5